MIVMDSVSAVYAECECCGHRNLLRRIPVKGMPFYVCESCVPKNDRRKLWD